MPAQFLHLFLCKQFNVSMVPGNLPSQLEILFWGQIYLQAVQCVSYWMSSSVARTQQKKLLLTYYGKSDIGG